MTADGALELKRNITVNSNFSYNKNSGNGMKCDWPRSLVEHILHDTR